MEIAVLGARFWRTALLIGLLSAMPGSCLADTLLGALADAYVGNPQLNAQRALVRATDENVPQALGGYRPRISASSSVGTQTNSTTQKLPTPPGQPASYLSQKGTNTPHSVGLTLTQTLLNGFQTANRTRQ